MLRRRVLRPIRSAELLSFDEPSGGLRLSYFREQHPHLRLNWNLVQSKKLRQAQLGAAWALSAHSTAPREPALVVLPTGVGKTLVLCLAPFLYRSRRVLVVTPGTLVRSQVASAFETLLDLKRSGVLPDNVPSPKVVAVEGRATTEKIQSWVSADVVIGTPNVLSSEYEGVSPLPEGFFDLVLFDEAHHLPARVWTSILKAHNGSAVLFTATPIRGDRKPLPGELVYSYPLARAIEDEVYAPVKFVPVEVIDADPDRSLALMAKTRLEDPIHKNAGSRLLVRTNTRVDAERLVEVYAAIGLRVGLVLGNTPAKQVSSTLSKVRHGELAGFVAVGAMVEGFDFPTLKVATYHSPHKTLAPTLQFMGRLSRATPSGVRGELLAIPDQVEGETRELYRQDRDWGELMPEIVEAAEREERHVRTYISQADVSGSLELAPRMLNPPRSARIYRVPDASPDLDIEPDRIARADVVFRFFDAETSLVAFVTHRTVAQRWADSPLLEVSEFSLHVATWVEEQRMLFVSTESRPALEDLLEAFGVEDKIRKLAPDDLVRLVHAAGPGNYFSVGLRAAHARRARGASYDMTAGAAVETALDYGQRSNSTLGHFMARPSDGNRGTIGFAVQKSKLWEAEDASSLLAFRRWAVERAADAEKPAPPGGLPGLHVLMGDPFEEFPDEVLGAVLNAEWFTGRHVLVVRGGRVHASDIVVTARREDPAWVRLTVEVGGELVWEGTQNSDGRVTRLSGYAEAVDPGTGEVGTVESAFEDCPVLLYLADGSSVVGNQLLPPRTKPEALPDGVLIADRWENIAIDKEVGETGTVQARTKAIAAGQAVWVATDHTSGELADFVSLRTEVGGVLKITLYHCKSSGGSLPGRRVSDLYDLIGQAVKSVPWTIEPRWLLNELLRRLDERDAFKVLHGGTDDGFRAYVAQLLADMPSHVDFEIVAVQPGVSISDLADWNHGLALVNAANEWCSAEGVVFRLLGSS